MEPFENHITEEEIAALSKYMDASPGPDDYKPEPTLTELVAEEESWAELFALERQPWLDAVEKRREQFAGHHQELLRLLKDIDHDETLKHFKIMNGIPEDVDDITVIHHAPWTVKDNGLTVSTEQKTVIKYKDKDGNEIIREGRQYQEELKPITFSSEPIDTEEEGSK